VVLAGFNRLNPVEQALIDRLPSTGIQVLTLLNTCAPAPPDMRRYPDADAECLAAAGWAQAWLASNPAARLAIVVPDLTQRRQRLLNTLEDVLAPWLAHPSQVEIQRPFNISLGRPVIDHGLAGGALALLDTLTPPFVLDQKTLSPVLLHPCWCGPATALWRAQVEAQIRRKLPAQITWTRLARFLQDCQGSEAPERQTLRQHVQALASLCEHLPDRQPPSEWAAWISLALPQAGWLAGYPLSSHEYQLQDTFHECIGQLATLDAFTGTMGLPEALRRLRQLCRERIFQPQTEGRQPLDILGLLEASGQRFDAVWVMGMEAGAWPPPIRTNPLLPAVAQRQAQAPNASADVQLAFARQVHRQLLQAAPEVIWSWPHLSGAAELRPSPLLAEAGQALTPTYHSCAGVMRWTDSAPDATHHTQAPLMDDHLAPPLQTGETVRGGTALLKAQAICPAWAYFRYRLGAGRLDEAAEGMDARQRGTLLHSALEHLWRHLQTSEQLHALDADALSVHVESAVQAAWAVRDADPAQETLEPRTRSLESRRLRRLLFAWLAMERERKHRFRVVATELQQPLDWGGLPIQVQIDRIDRLDDGQHLIIDYKTGSSLDTRNWSADRLTEPQLPLYAIWYASLGHPVTGIAFARVLPKEPGWAGLAAQERLLPRVMAFDSTINRKRFPPDRFPAWADVMAHWQTRLLAVAEEIRAGEAAVRCDDEALLAYCDVKPLLRLSERRQQWQEWERHGIDH
jgi:exodeoxyribonuclease-5